MYDKHVILNYEIVSFLYSLVYLYSRINCSLLRILVISSV